MPSGLIPMYDETGQPVMMTPEAALRAVQEGSAYPYDPTAIYSPEAAQQMAEFTAALQGEDVYTRRLQALAQQYGAQTTQYSAVAQNAYNMGQLLMNASINNPYQYAQQAFQTDGSAPGFARALQQGFSYGDAQADPFDTSRLKGWDFGHTSQEQGPPPKSQGAPDYGGTPPAAQSGTPPPAPMAAAGPPQSSMAGHVRQPGSQAGAPPVAGSGGYGQPGPTTAYGSGTGAPLAVQTPVGGGPGQVYSATLGRWVSQIPGAQPVAPAAPATNAYSNTSAAPMTAYGPSSAVYGTNGKVDTGQYGRASGLSGSGSSDIAWVNKSHNLIESMGYGHGSDARNAAHQAAGMTGEEFDRIVKHGGDPFHPNHAATGGEFRVATRPQTVVVGEHGKDELLVFPLQRPGTAVPGFAAQIANSLHPEGHYLPHGGDDPLHMAQGGAVYGSGVDTLGVGSYGMSGGTPTPQGSVRVYANRGGMKTAPVGEGVMPAGMADPTALDKIAANQFLARQYDSLLKASGYAGLDDYIARNTAARPQQRVQAGLAYRGY